MKGILIGILLFVAPATTTGQSCPVKLPFALTLQLEGRFVDSRGSEDPNSSTSYDTVEGQDRVSFIIDSTIVGSSFSYSGDSLVFRFSENIGSRAGSDSALLVFDPSGRIITFLSLRSSWEYWDGSGSMPSTTWNILSFDCRNIPYRGDSLESTGPISSASLLIVTDEHFHMSQQSPHNFPIFYGSSFIGDTVLLAGGSILAKSIVNDGYRLSPQMFAATQLPTIVGFSFPSGFHATSIRIFDLLGRERDVISIAPGSESYEYNTARLTPGMYIASLAGSAVKFIVR